MQEPKATSRAFFRRWAFDAVLALLLTAGYVSPLLLLGVSGLFRGQAGEWHLVGLIGVCLVATVVLVRAIRRWGRRPFRIAAEVLVLVVLVVWGLVYSHSATTTCVSCGAEAFRPLAEPEVAGLVVLHVLSALAYAVSRRRPYLLSTTVELFVSSSLMVGVVMQVFLAIQFGSWMLMGILLPPILIPCLAPPLTIILYVCELHARLCRIGRKSESEGPAAQAEEGLAEGALAEGALAEEAQTEEAQTEEALAEGALAEEAQAKEARAKWWASAGLGTAWIGLYTLLHAVWRGHASGALDVFTRTCGYTMSQIPIVEVDCHYLCTVAARGHAWLVRPERLGQRHGRPVVVNRQLSIANAFEDWLSEQCPRFAKLARRIYDHCGLPISRHLQTPWRADLVYIIMKPFEWAFLLALLLLDPDSPESRIDRMYR